MFILDTPIISSYNPYATWIPIGVIFAITCIREGVEDYHLYKRDKVVSILFANRKAVNNSVVRVLRGDLLIEIKSKELQVGDIVYISWFPLQM